MTLRHFLLLLGPVTLAILDAGAVFAQDYPSKPVRMVTSEPAGANDILLRMISPAISVALGQPVIVDNRAGIIAIESVAKATPDGYTLLFYGQPVWLLPFAQDKPTYDPVKTFAPITVVAISPNIVVVHPSLPVKSVKELIALAKANPGKLNYASGATGAPSHLAPELLKSMAGIDIVRVPFKSAGPGITALIAGEVQLMINNATAALPHVKSGRVRALAVTSAHPFPLAPTLPTVAASGVPGYESTSSLGVMAPAATPAMVISQLNREIVRVVKQREVQDKFLTTGSVPVGSLPDEFAATIKSEMTRLGKVIKGGGIKAE